MPERSAWPALAGGVTRTGSYRSGATSGTVAGQEPGLLVRSGAVPCGRLVARRERGA